MSEQTLPIQTEADILAARQTARGLARQLGFSDTELVLIATAISEIARNTLQYGGGGEMEVSAVSREGRSGLFIRAKDRGPGIADISLAMQDGFSTGRGLGLGLPGAKRLMDEFQVDSTPGQGTTVTMTKWVR
jgi:serine/threonine-protein kinase RsbT